MADRRRVCAESGCPTLTTSTRCDEHRRARDKARGTRQQRGYGLDHDRRRAAAVAALDAGRTLTCWRCKQPINDIETLHIGHDDDDRSVTRGPEHAICNLKAAGAKSPTRPWGGG